MLPLTLFGLSGHHFKSPIQVQWLGYKSFPAHGKGLSPGAVGVLTSLKQGVSEYKTAQANDPHSWVLG